MPASGEANRATILANLRATIALATESGARPLLEKAEARLNAMLADSA